MWKQVLLFILFLFLPACVSRATSTPASSFMSPPSYGSSFPQRINTPSAYTDALITGELVVTNGCLRVKEKYGNNVLLIWPVGFSPHTEQGIIQVLDSTGQAVASVGDWVEIGGGEVPPTYLDLVDPLPENCPGPYWLVGDYIKKIDRP
jgi:hypothetical protein